MVHFTATVVVVCNFVVVSTGLYLTPSNLTINLYPGVQSEGVLETVRAYLEPQESGEINFFAYPNPKYGRKSRCPDVEVKKQNYLALIIFKKPPAFPNGEGNFRCYYSIEAVLISTRNDVARTSRQSQAESYLTFNISGLPITDLQKFDCSSSRVQEYICFGGVSQLAVQVLENSDRTDVVSFGIGNHDCSLNFTFKAIDLNASRKDVIVLKKSKHEHLIDVWTRAELDREMVSIYNLDLSCSVMVNNETRGSYHIPILVNILDQNDNVPLTRTNVSEATIFYKLDTRRLQPGERLAPNDGDVEISFWDKDSLQVNDFHVNVVNDSKRLVDVRISSEANLVLINDTPPVSFVVLKTVWRNPGFVVFDGVYCVLVIVNDVAFVASTLRHGDSKIRFNVCLYFEGRQKPVVVTVKASEETSHNNVINYSRGKYSVVATTTPFPAPLIASKSYCGQDCFLVTIILSILGMSVIVLAILYKMSITSKAPCVSFNNGRNDVIESLKDQSKLEPIVISYRGGKCEDVLKPDDAVTFSLESARTSLKGRRPIDSLWELPRLSIRLEHLLGEGEFGRVLKGQLKLTSDSGIATKQVAIKILKNNNRESGSCSHHEFMAEFLSLKETNHPNIIKLYGVCTTSDPYYLVMEYAELSSLKTYLKKCRKLKVANMNSQSEHNFSSCSINEDPKKLYTVTPEDVLIFSLQIANGMAYLSRLKIIHRDLAARNILLTAGKVCKISDFGLSRDVYLDDKYVKQSEGKVPIKWLSLESLKSGVYTVGSDVWSFGVLMWEISSIGLNPYPGVPPKQIYSLLRSGYRMPEPADCPAQLYSLMRKCWKEEPFARPTFRECECYLLELLLDIRESSGQILMTANFVTNPMYEINEQTFFSFSDYSPSKRNCRRPSSFPPSSPVRDGIKIYWGHSMTNLKMNDVSYCSSQMGCRKSSHIYQNIECHENPRSGAGVHQKLCQYYV